MPSLIVICYPALIECRYSYQCLTFDSERQHRVFQVNEQILDQPHHSTYTFHSLFWGGGTEHKCTSLSNHPFTSRRQNSILPYQRWGIVMLLNAVKEQLSFIHPCIHPSVESAECMYIYIYIYSYGVLWHRKRPLRASSYCVWLHTAARIVCSKWRFVTKGALHVRRFSMFCHPCWVYASSLRFATQGARASLDRDMFLYKPFLSILIQNCNFELFKPFCSTYLYRENSTTSDTSEVFGHSDGTISAGLGHGELGTFGFEGSQQWPRRCHMKKLDDAVWCRCFSWDACVFLCSSRKNKRGLWKELY